MSTQQRIQNSDLPLVRPMRQMHPAHQAQSEILADGVNLLQTSTKNEFEQYCNEPVVDNGFWEPHLNTDYDSEEI